MNGGLPLPIGSPRGSRSPWFVACGVLVCCTALLYAGQTLCAERDDDEKPVQELATQLPPFPRPENLIPFFVSAITENRFMIDGESLSVSADGIVRYTVVIVSPSGVQNVGFEGLRCSAGEYRLYATGRADETWSKARSSRWIKIQENSLNRHHAELYDQYFCPIGNPVHDADEARQVLRSGGHPSVRHR